MNNLGNINIVISLLKDHNIRYIVASPGGTNIALVSAFQNDSFLDAFPSLTREVLCILPLDCIYRRENLSLCHVQVHRRLEIIYQA